MAEPIAPTSGAHTASHFDKPKVIYVMGAGRSGSTIFGVALGNCEGIFDAGELEAWLRRSGVPNFGGDERLRFWTAIRDEVGGDDLYGTRAWLCLEHSSSLYRLDRWMHRRQLRPRYREYAEHLYHALAQTSGAAHIVDTSHYPLRVSELKHLDGIDLYLVYLVREPQSVVASFERRDVAQRSKPPIATNLYLWFTHLLSVSVFLRYRRDRRILVRFEDFMADPDNVLREVLDMVGAQVEVPDLASLASGIPFQGNRLLETDVIPFRRGAETAETGSRGSRLTRLLQHPWTAVFARLRPTATRQP